MLSAVSVMAFVKSMEDEGMYRIVDGRLVRGNSYARHNVSQYYDQVGLEPPPRKKKHAGEDRAAVAAEAAARAERAEALRKQAEREAAAEQANSFGMGYGLIVPFFYAPIVPLMRVGLRGRVSPERLTQLTLGVIGVGLAHAGSYMFADSSVALRR